MLGEGRYVLFNPELNVQMQVWDELFLLLLNQMHDTIFLRKVPMTGW